MIFQSNALYQALRLDLDGAHENGSCPDASPYQFAAHRLMTQILTKYVEETAVDADEKAKEKFLAINDENKEWRLSMETTLDELLVGTFRSKMHAFFTPRGESLLQNAGQIFDRGRASLHRQGL